MAELINVNGAITAAGEALIPVLDHGFLYGDGVYETLRTYDGEPCLVDRHLRRLAASCERIRIPPLPPSRVEGELKRTLAEAGNTESQIRIMVTRGVGTLGYEISLCSRPSLVIIVLPLREVPAERYTNGVTAFVGERRRNPVDSLDPAIKSCNLLNNLLAYMEGQDARAIETILLNTRGFLAEGSRTNVFFVRNGVLKTPSLDCGILEGITRQVLLELASEIGLPCEEGRFTQRDLEEADEVFVTSTLQELLPVTHLNGRSVGDGRPGPTTRRLLDLYRRYVRRKPPA